MFCPTCGQEKVSPDTNFCSRCGYLLSDTAELMQTGGAIPQGKASSPRARGIKQAVSIFLLALIIPPLIAFIARALGYGDYMIPLIIGSAVILCFNGALRLAYALNFEKSSPAGGEVDFLTAAQKHFGRSSSAALPSLQSIPASLYATPKAGNWRETNDLEPTSVVEGATRPLEEDARPQ